MKRLIAAFMLMAAPCLNAQLLSPINFPVFRALDQNGKPLAGGKLYTYAAGTSTLQVTYTDATGASPNTNPVILDSTGTAHVFMAPLTYKFILQDASGVVQWTADNIIGSQGQAITSLPSGSQTITQPAGTNLNVNTSAGGKFNYNGNEVLTVATGCLAANCLILNPTATQSINQPAGTFTKMNALSADSNLITTNAGAGMILRAWGNSQTAGYGAGPDCPIGNLTCTSVNAWPSIMAQKMGWTVDNQAVSSSDCADLTYQGQNKSMWDVTYPILDNTRTVYAHFRNDQSQYGPLPYRVDYARGCVEAQMAWLAIPEVSTTTTNPSKFRASSGLVGKTGTWSSVGEPNTASMSTTQAGATMQFVVRGNTVYIATQRKNPSSATYTVQVDGNLVYDPITQSTTFNQALDVGTSGGFPVSEAIIPYLIRVSGLVTGTHVVTYTCVNPSGDSCRVFYGAGVGTDNSTANGPIVYSLSPVNNADAQATGFFSFPVTQLYLNEWHRIVSELSGDGLQIIGLDATNLNVYWADAQNIGDGIHPNTAGQAAIGNAMVSKATLASTPQDRVESKATNTSTGYGGFGAGPAPSPSGGGATNPSYHIPAGSLWSSTGAQTGQVYLGFDGGAFLARIPNDLSNAMGFGTGKIFTFNSPDSTLDVNLALPGQYTSYKSSTGDGGKYSFSNGANASYITQAGTTPLVPSWANHAVFLGDGDGIIYNAANSSADQQWQINSGTLLTLTSVHMDAQVPYSFHGVDLPITGTPQLGKAACIKATGPPVVIGSCSTSVDAAGACTCN